MLTRTQGLELGRHIIDAVDSRPITRQQQPGGLFDVAVIPLEPPRRIGDELAVVVKVMKPITAVAVAGAVYFPDEAMVGKPVRLLGIREGGEVYGIWDGTFDANEYVPTTQHANELLHDIGAEAQF